MVVKRISGLMQTLLKDVPEEGKPGFGFGYVFVFPLPSCTTEEEEEEFRKKFIQPTGMTHVELLRHSVIVHDDFKQSQRCNIQCGSSLKSLRCATIELFESFLKSVFASHDAANEGGESTVFTFTSVDTDELFVCVKMSDAAAEVLADVGEYQLQVDPKAFPKINIELPDDGEIAPAYIKFDEFMKREGLLKEYEKPENPGTYSILRQVDRQRILYDKVRDFVSLPELHRLGLLLHSYPAHNAAALKKLKGKWGNLKLICSCTQPIDEIRDYFGEAVAFYFLFVQHLGRAQAVFAIAFIPCGVLYYMLPKDSKYVTLVQVIYSWCLMLWYFGFLKHWRRTMNKYANRWGTDIKDAENSIRPPVNPAFQGELRPSPYNSLEVFEQPNEQKQRKGKIISVVVTIAFLLLITVSVGINQFIGAKMDAAHPGGPYLKIAALALSMQIKILDYVWEIVAQKITDMEQHPTLLESNQSKASKTFSVKFVNTFYAFVYTAFFQATIDESSCGPNGASDCPQLLVSNLIIVYVTYISFGVLGMITPLLTFKYEVYKEAKEMKKKGLAPNSLSLLEQQAKMLEYTGQSLTDDYLEVIFPVAFILMFSMMVPLVTNVLAIIQTFTQIRTDAWKLCSAYRRVFPDRVDGIGVWLQVLDGFVPLCVVMNMLLTLTQFKDESFLYLISPSSFLVDSYKANPFLVKAFVFFVGYEVWMTVYRFIDHWIPNDSARLTLSKLRQEKQRLRIFQFQDIAQAEEKKEHIVMKSTGDADRVAHDARPPLQPGDPMYVDPLV
eukprot:TRINITY_DN2844_c0_g3_i1.p1 TRINITY_DN2844_c0_g3~~TRINITY_DN2844_c0_g3_i1.p1  ORF type:complete len:782 (-),score=180.58 TRINITY_DN2844_c0_g3_i1:114-2459(-)